MMGQHDRSEALFYYFRLEDQVNRRPVAKRICWYVLDILTTLVTPTASELEG